MGRPLLKPRLVAMADSSFSSSTLRFSCNHHVGTGIGDVIAHRMQAIAHCEQAIDHCVEAIDHCEQAIDHCVQAIDHCVQAIRLITVCR